MKYLIELNEDSDYVIIEKTVVTGTATNDTPDSEVFVSFEELAYSEGADPSSVFEYLAHFGGGWVGISCDCSGEANQYLFTTDETLGIGDVLVVEYEDFTVCFLAGTAIDCPDGRRPVEDLAVGDLVLTADGQVRPIRFVGRQSHAALFSDRLRTHPVRIAAGALGEGLPIRDLCLSPDHALLVGGVLVQAGALVNGGTIAPMIGVPERFTYFHVELEDHHLILAEGVPAETFVDNVTRRRFDNYADYEVLYGPHVASIAEMPVPRVKSTRQLPRALRDRLEARAAA